MNRKIQDTLLHSILFSYNKIALEFNSTEEKKLLNVLNTIKKYEKKVKVKLTKQESIICENKFNELKKLDSELFDNKDFSSLIMVILFINYLVEDFKSDSARVNISHIDTWELIQMMETSKLRSTVSNHHYVFSEMLKRIEL